MKSKIILFLFFLTMGILLKSSGQEQGIIDSLLTELKSANTDSAKVKILFNLSEQSLDDRDVLSYAQQSLQLAQKLNYKKDIANAFNNIAYVHLNKGDIPQAIAYYNSSLNIRKALNDKEGLAESYLSLGYIFEHQGNNMEALDYYQKSLKLTEESGDKEAMAGLLINMAAIYRDQGDQVKTFENYQKSLKLYEESGNKQGVSISQHNIGAWYYRQGNVDKALEYYNRALKLREIINDKRAISQSLNAIGSIYTSLKNYQIALDYQLRGLHIQEEIGDKLEIARSLNDIGILYGYQKKYKLSEDFCNRSLTIASELGFPEEIRNASQYLSTVSAEQNKFKTAYEMQVLFKKMADSISNVETRKSTVRKQMQFEFEKKEAGVKAAHDKKEALSQAALKRQKLIRNTLISGLGIVLIFAGIFFIQRNRIRRAKKRSDELLLNILPAETAEELKNTGSAEAKSYDQVTVLFTDFKNFTLISEQMSAQALVKEINFCYSEFDKIISKYRIEKIKTIGDSYMCAGGLPVKNKTNPADTINAAIEICSFMKERKRNAANDSLVFEIRLGIHTGPVVAGIVGIKKFAYDIWGDTVNIASRMETSGEPGKINISGNTYGMVKDQFKCTYRGKLEVKNKGAIDMYFVEDADHV